MNLNLLIGVISSLAGIFVFIKYVIIVEIRLDNSIGKDLLKIIKLKNKYIPINEEIQTKDGIPNIFSCLTKIGGIPIYYSRGERLLTAGWRGVDNVTTIVTLRIFHKRLKKDLRVMIKSVGTIDVNVVGNYGYNKIGTISTVGYSVPYLEDEVYQDIENDMQLLQNGVINKSGLLLYGSPGNGKTQLIRYLAIKYKLDVAIITFNADYTNEDILLMFAEIPNNSIVLLEDFDSVFDNRKCLIESQNIKFTFDGLLNALDGIWSSDKKLVYCITCNDINKIDDSIKNRRSRVKFIREIKPPSYLIRKRILLDEELTEKTHDLSLDKVFYVKDQLEAGFKFDYILRNINE